MKRNTVRKHTISRITVFLFLSFPLPIYGQVLSEKPDSIIRAASELMYQSYKKADSAFSRLAPLIQDSEREQGTLLTIKLLHARAAAASYHSKLSDMELYITASLKFINANSKRLAKRADSLEMESKFFRAIYYNEIGQYDYALADLSDVKTFYRNRVRDKDICKKLFQVLQYEASIYLMKGEYESSINEYLASIQYYDCYRDKNKYPNYLLIFRNLALAHWKKGDEATTYDYFKRAEAHLDSCLIMSDDLATVKIYALILFDNIADYFAQKGQLDSAKLYLNRALSLVDENPGFAIRPYLRMGRIALIEHKFPEAIRYFNKTKELSSGGAYLTEANGAIAEVYAKQKAFKQALHFVQLAIKNLTGDAFDANNIWLNPSLQTVASERQMIALLHQKAQLLKTYSESSNDIKLLRYAHNTCNAAIQLIDSTRFDFTLDKDKVVLGEEVVRVYQSALSISYSLWQITGDEKYLEECFQLMDRSKSAVLHDHLKLVKSFSGIPEDIVEKERQFRAEISATEENIFSSESAGMDASNEREALSNLKRKYSKHLAEIRSSYSDYYRLKVDNGLISVSDVQNRLLSPGQALVEYFVGDSILYIMFVSRDKRLISSAPVKSLVENVTELRKCIIQAAQSECVPMLSISVYNQLIRPWIGMVDSTISSLVFIPHGVLSGLPFEILFGGDNDILMKRFHISYAYSGSLLEQQNKRRKSGRSLAGFNADYSRHKTLPSLFGSLKELNTIEKVLGSPSTMFLNSTADQFRQHAPDFKVLHLALHSFINDEKPLFSKLVFSTDASGNTTEITANELYAMQLNAELAVLSACESGIGKLHKGEGMMSLSRAFMYAGVPSTVISLWKVPDHATARLMEKFYTFLKEGQRKDEALANAKRSFIKEYPEMSSPYFWAGFIVNGKCDPITFSVFESAQWSRVGIIVLFIALIVTAIIQWRRHHTKERSVQAFVNQR